MKMNKTTRQFAFVCAAAVAAFAARANVTSRESGFDSFVSTSGGTPSFEFGRNGVRGGPMSYTGQAQVVLKECCVYPPLATNIPCLATFDRLAKYGGRGYFKSTYLVLAENIMDIDLDGLVVESITDSSGKDYSKKKNGDANWEVDSFCMSVDRKRGVATFVLYGGGKVWARSLPTVKGRVSITVAGKMATKELAGKVSSGRIGDADCSYKVKLAKNFMDDEKSLEVVPAGDRADGELEVFCGGKKLDCRATMSVNGKTTYTFKQPSSDDIVIKVTCPVGGKKVVIPFG